jgi:hypothetical protein
MSLFLWMVTYLVKVTVAMPKYVHRQTQLKADLILYMLCANDTHR